MSTKLNVTRVNAKLAIAALIVASSIGALFASAADSPAPANSSQKLSAGLAPTVRLLQLMDTDQNGKVSKEEFMRFMEAEFEFADQNEDQELDPKELQHLVQNLSHPRRGPGK